MKLLYRLAVYVIITAGILTIAYSQLSLLDSPDYTGYQQLHTIGLVGLVIVLFGSFLVWIDHMGKK